MTCWKMSILTLVTILKVFLDCSCFCFFFVFMSSNLSCMARNIDQKDDAWKIDVLDQ